MESKSNYIILTKLIYIHRERDSQATDFGEAEEEENKTGKNHRSRSHRDVRPTMADKADPRCAGAPEERAGPLLLLHPRWVCASLVSSRPPFVERGDSLLLELEDAEPHTMYMYMIIKIT